MEGQRGKEGRRMEEEGKKKRMEQNIIFLNLHSICTKWSISCYKICTIWSFTLATSSILMSVKDH